MLAVVLGLPAFSPVQGVGRSRWGTPHNSRMSAVSGSRPVPLTGQTLQAALKIRCDTTGAQYAIYWSDQGGVLQATGTYAAKPSAAQYTRESQEVTLDAGGQGPIALVQRTGSPFFIPDVRVSTLKRKELALKYGISQVAMLPFEAGVIEFGNCRTCEQWAGIPDAPIIPKAPLRTAFEDLGALYVMFWKADFVNKELRVIGHYENPRDARRRLALRGDGKSFVKISRELTLDLDDDGPVQEALRTGQEVVVGFDSDDAYPLCKSMKRASYAKEFQLGFADFVPVNDGNQVGVLEFGVSTSAELSPVTLDATLQMQVQSTTAAFGVYWKTEGTTARPVKTFTSPWYAEQLKAMGKQYTFVDITEQTTASLTDGSPIAHAIRTRSKVYVADASATPDSRASVAAEYGIVSLAYVPVVGGVFEYGVPAGVWASEQDALAQTIPNEEVDVAIEAGCSYLLFWKANWATGRFEVAASYERSESRLSNSVKEGDSYVSSAAAKSLNIAGSGPIATAFRSAATLDVANTATYPNFGRRDLCLEWGVGKFTAIPLETGVLEFGKVTKDKRETTTGSEYKESSRQYRRTVFMHDEWADHRSTDRFIKSLSSTLESGVLRGRQDEVTAITAFAAAIVGWNLLAGGFTGFGMVKHGPIIPFLPIISLPMTFFSLTGSSLGLLLVFRTNVRTPSAQT